MTQVPALSFDPFGKIGGGTSLLTPHLDFAPLDCGQRVEAFAIRYGRSYDAYLTTEPGWEYFWSAGYRGVVAIARRGRHSFSSGGLLAPKEHRKELLEQLVDRATANGDTLSFFNITEEDLPIFRKLGFQATKWGEEALVDLKDRTWSGKSFEWVRRQSNFCRRHGLVVTECVQEALSDYEWRHITDELAVIAALFLRTKPQAREVRFLEGGFDLNNLTGKRLFIARSENGDGRIEGFVACNPCAAGRTWVMETYRQRPDAVRGTIPFIMHQAMQKFQAEGVDQVSLCLLPGLNCNEPLPGDSAMVRWGLSIGTGRVSVGFRMAGAYHFKSRFRPRFESRYLCVRPKMSFGVAVAFIRLLGVLELDIRKLCRLAFRKWRKRLSRATHAGE